MKIEFHSSEKGFRKGLLFLSGRGKMIESWNVTSTGKKIDLELGFRERAQTALVEFDEKDYELYLTGGDAPDLIEQLDPKVKWVVVASSMGGYFASLLPEKLLLGILIIDSPPRLSRTDFKVPVRVHLKVTAEVKPDFDFWDQVTSYNAKSEVVVHWDASHLIHWDQPGKIRTSIEELLRS